MPTPDVPGALIESYFHAPAKIAAVQSPPRPGFWPRHHGAPLKRFRYLRDSLFLAACALYAANRWLVKPHVHLAFFHNWFDDIWLIPCALPPLLLVHDWLGLRKRGAPPSTLEILAHLIGWTVLFEIIGPHIMRTTGDPWDAVAYAGGALLAMLWWRFAYAGGHRTNTANFDFLAPHYRWMEWLLAGPKLQHCRTAFLKSIPRPRRVLLLGEGNGRFLVELLRAHPAARCVCADASARMLDCARARLRRHGLDPDAVEFIHADALDWSWPSPSFDLIVSHFFLDCFSPEQLVKIIPRIAAAAAPGARWLLADFREPVAGPAKWRARAILALMYFFFHHAARLPARRLTPPDALLAQSGFALRERQLRDWGLLHSDLWQLVASSPSLNPVTHSPFPAAPFQQPKTGAPSPVLQT
jgi:ubiquinone/menaquinone biosynthesis C-methylase UbiE